MPYRDHRAFDAPEHWGDTIWRYITIPQIISMIDKGSLYFRRSDLFNDPFEGTLPRKNIETLREDLDISDYDDINGPIELPQTGTKRDGSVSWSHASNLRTELEIYRKISYVNCWHKKPHESIAMWDSNLDSSSGIVIKSTATSLRKSLNATDKEVFIGMVNYIDFEEDEIERENLLRQHTYKRKGFDHENELRAVFTKTPTKSDPDNIPEMEKVEFDWKNQKQGYHIDINVGELIEEIRISPNGPDWHQELIEDVIDQYNVSNVEVKKSDLDTSPKLFNT